MNEDHTIDEKKLKPYGKNRLLLEKWVTNNYPDSNIVRLPALIGHNLRKNFVYDIIWQVPTYLTNNKYEELSKKSQLIKDSYTPITNQYFKIKAKTNLNNLKEEFKSLDFNSLLFTDSRSTFQYYPLSRLWHDINYCINNKIKLLNLTTPPVKASEIYSTLTNKDFSNNLDTWYDYNIKTKWFKDGYIMTKKEELEQIKSFFRSETLS